tara:strand:- start:10282 stop:11451 length:1170 start_codon:yes stop_codon:yes gene_type:complete
MSEIHITDIMPFVVSAIKYVVLVVGGFNILPNDGLVFISSNQQAQGKFVPHNVFKSICSLLGNMFYTVDKYSTHFIANRTDSRILLTNKRNLINSEIQFPISQTMTWIHNNIFLVNMSCILILVASLTIIYFSVQLCRKEQSGISYINYVIRVLLVSYYSLTNMALIYIVGSRQSAALSVMAIAVLFFNTLCLPLFCINAIRKYKNSLNERKTIEDYGCIYSQYKTGFAYLSSILLFKQFFYSIIYVLSHFELINWIACMCIQAVINVLFILFISKFKPFTKKIHQIQAISISCLKIVIVIICGILYGKNMNLGIVTQFFYSLIIFINMLCFTLPFIPCYKKWQQRLAEKHRQMSVDSFVRRSSLPEWVVEEYVQNQYELTSIQKRRNI